MKNYSYYIALKGILLLGLMVFSLNTSAQKIRYVNTKTIDKNGMQRTFGINEGSVIVLEFSGDRIQHITYSIPSSPVFFGFHHRDGSNSVYYQIATDIISGKKWYNESSVMVVSPDRSLINCISYFQGHRQSTEVFERHDADTYGTMVR